MKSILYTGAALMIGASLYGVADYSKTKNQNEFKKMYHDETAVNISKARTGPQPVIIETQIEKPVDHAKPLKRKSEESNLKIESDPADVTYVEEKETRTEKRNRKLNTKIFSRAPLRDYEEADTSIIVEKKKN